MDAHRARQIEQAVAWLAAAVLAAAAGVAALGFGLAPAAAAALALPLMFGTWRVLDAVDGAAPLLPLAAFALEPLPEPIEEDVLLLTEPVAVSELVLTQADQFVVAPMAAEEGELVLDDVLRAPGEDSRVVRLFDVLAMPAPAPQVDASQALHDALSDLRRSLR